MVRSSKDKVLISKPWAGADQPRADTGRFASHYEEPRGEAIALRLPKSLDEKLRQVVGWHSKADNPALKAWVEAAILEKLERQHSAETAISHRLSPLDEEQTG